ncbi:MAG: TonB-dependent receptor [Cyclobacteriaceae bacterium]
MKRSIHLIKVLVFILLCHSMAVSQPITSISGRVTDDKTNEGLIGVNVLVKGLVTGTTTNRNGNFYLNIQQPLPITLQISYVGYSNKEVIVTEQKKEDLQIQLSDEIMLGDEIVVSASRVEERILESPVTIEKMDILAIQNTASDNYYKAIANLKGVDVTTSSINFQIINTRGFGSTGNTRFVQLIDGMDTQAPALNFPIGNLNGPSELDVESVELIPGAASALYGPNAFNGVLLINSKSPFEYQGLSAFTKIGMNHLGNNADQGVAPMYEASVRYAKAFNNKFAFKVNFSYMKADDWVGSDATDREIDRTPEVDGQRLSFNPGSDRLHFMGDEASINLAIFPFSESWNVFASTNNSVQSNIFAPGRSARAFAQAGDLPSHVVSITPFRERDLINYNANNMKLNTGLYYRINDDLELSYLLNAGYGTSIYTGAQRYSLSDFSIVQHRLQLRGNNFYVRGYTTRENSGNSYITEFLGKRVIDITMQEQTNGFFNDVSGYLATYGAEYLRHLHNLGLQPGEINSLSNDELMNITGQNRYQIVENAHIFARGSVDDRFVYEPGTPEFESAKARAMEGVVPDGPKFQDATTMSHFEGQYDFADQIDFMELQAGASFRRFNLRSSGTIFDDGIDPITIDEFGTYVQAGKWVGNRRAKISGSLRYDKNENFQGQINPRISLVYKLHENHNLRVSYQTGFRIPSTQGQHIDLNIISARLLGGLPRYQEKYDLIRTSTTGQPLAFEGFSVQDFRNEVFRTGEITETATNRLVPVTNLDPVRPEQVRSLEFGYKSSIANKLLIDGSVYYNIYNDFISQVRIVTATEDGAGNPNYASILNSTAGILGSNGVITGNTYQVYTNLADEVTTMGAALGLTYSLPKGYMLTGNYSWNVMNDVPEGFLAEFNTPEHKFNLSFGNRKLTKNFGFNITYRWQDEFEWQSSFTIPANGMVPAFSTLDGQLSYHFSEMNSILKIGGSNLLNQYYLQSLGGPRIGAIYYMSLTFDIGTL